MASFVKYFIVFSLVFWAACTSYPIFSDVHQDPSRIGLQLASRNDMLLPGMTQEGPEG